MFAGKKKIKKKKKVRLLPPAIPVNDLAPQCEADVAWTWMCYSLQLPLFPWVNHCISVLWHRNHTQNMWFKCLKLCLFVWGTIGLLTASQLFQLTLNTSLEENLIVFGSFERQFVDVQRGIFKGVFKSNWWRHFQLPHWFQILTPSRGNSQSLGLLGPKGTLFLCPLLKLRLGSFL